MAPDDPSFVVPPRVMFASSSLPSIGRRTGDHAFANLPRKGSDIGTPREASGWVSRWFHPAPASTPPSLPSGRAGLSGPVTPNVSTATELPAPYNPAAEDAPWWFCPWITVACVAPGSCPQWACRPRVLHHLAHATPTHFHHFLHLGVLLEEAVNGLMQTGTEAMRLCVNPG
jgi:hypothetical protein